MRLALTALLVLLAAPQALYACTCIAVDPKTAFKRAEAVFVGEVLSYENEIARMRPIEWFKGTKTDVVEFVTVSSSAACGYGDRLGPGSRHLIYAYRREPGTHPEVSSCSRSRPETHAECDLTYLRSRAAWWRSPLSSFRALQWLGLRWKPCPRNSP
jgi:hypothetical protein